MAAVALPGIISGRSISMEKGVPKNRALAISYYKKAADLGTALAQYDLGLCFADHACKGFF